MLIFHRVFLFLTHFFKSHDGNRKEKTRTIDPKLFLEVTEKMNCIIVLKIMKWNPWNFNTRMLKKGLFL